MEDDDLMEAVVSQIHKKLGSNSYRLKLTYRLKPLHHKATLKQEGFEGGETLDLVAIHYSLSSADARAGMAGGLTASDDDIIDTGDITI